MKREEEHALRSSLHLRACDITDAANRLVIISHDAHTETLRIAVQNIQESIDDYIDKLRQAEDLGLH